MTTETETKDVEYRDVPGFPGYRVGSDGTVWSCRNRGGRGGIGKTWRELKHRAGPHGYRQISFLRDGKHVTQYIHRVVLLAFVGMPPEGMQARHYNGVNNDNRIENLSWSTPKENHSDKVQHGTHNRGERHNCVRLSNSDVLSVRSMREAGMKLIVISRRFGISTQHVSRICRGERWSHDLREDATNV